MSFSRVKIAARLRPPIPGEQHDNAIRVLRQDREGQSNSAIVVDNPRDPSQTFNYPFSSCYGEFSSQEEIFERDVKPLIDLAFSGMTVTIFAYGVTSSGKTHTMQGSAEQPGIIPRAVQEIFNRTVSQHVGASIAASYMEIYKDEVYDLLGDRESAAKLPVRENEHGKVFVANLSTIPLDTLDDFETAFSQANKQRSVGSTNLNSVSSRSHAILTLHVTVTDPLQNRTLSGKLNLVDLAGSENNKLTGNDSSRMAESAAINKSLSVLGQVVHALNQGASRIPYRNSKLTRILQDALGGNSVGLLICNLAPGTKFRQDTLNTLNFAVRTKNIQNKPLVNQQANATAGPSSVTIPPPAARSIPAPAHTSRIAGPRPSRVPRMSNAGAGPRPSLAFSNIPPPAVKRESLPPPAPVMPAHLTEEEINARIAKAVELEVARRLEEREEAARKERSMSVLHEEHGSASAGSLHSLPPGLLSPLLKKQRHSADDELKQRLEELESKFERGDKDKRMSDVLLSPLSRKKTGRAYVALARAHTQKNNLQVALELYRKAETYVPDNVKLKERIIEIEWAIKNDRPFAPSPKKPRRGPSRRAKGGSSKHRPAPDAGSDDDAPDSGKENEGYADAEDKEEGGSAKRRRRHVKSEEREREPGTPPKRRRLVKFEDAYA
ncbi:kinesin-domain-containing protein [Trametes versicolor FP-101664 SS1]|uniref:kinesin-domain-containing protein n=1 Tax=Trametes versicolor (strain FP-101664) TaxID=717944 RepID=UPI0004621529|nr:kinesin-domain-containing protein [Trametes versicolor FP-101664 SS1]EIW55394.1 kinesin-domain-containing protein [Trametes versicolor FP-101664 SS1]